MEFNDVIKQRYSCRQFSDKQVEEETLKEILEAGRIAPTAKNIQPVKIFAVQSSEGLNKIDQVTRCRYNAPTVLIVCGDTNSCFSYNGHSAHEIDSSIVATHIMLAATNLNVDNIWIGLFDQNDVIKTFDLPAGLMPVCLIDLGYKVDDCQPASKHYLRKELEQIVEFI